MSCPVTRIQCCRSAARALYGPGNGFQSGIYSNDTETHSLWRKMENFSYL